MTSTRGMWLRPLAIALTILVMPAGTSALWAQGYGPDPFRPYNSQYDAYTYPIGPSSSEAGQGAAMARMGNRGANQYQGYLDELTGASRQGAERYGIGMPYYRSAVDPTFDPTGKREYRPNREADRTYEQTQELVTRKYLAYFAEKDPKKRAELLREYDRTRARVSRALATRRGSPSRILDEAAGNGLDQRGSPSTAPGAGALPATADGKPRASSARSSSRGMSGDASGSVGTGSIPPPPPIFGGIGSRRTSPRRSPSEVLDRSRRINSKDDVKPRPGARTTADPDTDRDPLSSAPSPE